MRVLTGRMVLIPLALLACLVQMVVMAMDGEELLEELKKKAKGLIREKRLLQSQLQELAMEMNHSQPTDACTTEWVAKRNRLQAEDARVIQEIIDVKERLQKIKQASVEAHCTYVERVIRKLTKLERAALEDGFVSLEQDLIQLRRSFEVMVSDPKAKLDGRTQEYIVLVRRIGWLRRTLTDEDQVSDALTIELTGLVQMKATLKREIAALAEAITQITQSFHAQITLLMNKLEVLVQQRNDLRKPFIGAKFMIQGPESTC